ncbi:bifunctional indole-3-glycerol-phosphate synthase TrpC/phosphoribosylanthranilate isomerase TrpF [Pantoea sp. Aalb]|uniref:bifunctional indole-3-glycerol-phosphate synthase TrpC/phosphoribosylanthranilate isomerase TrpF n=1 Tax=Pantoea sp. Aalb TaxID=2576762 RepID=UPI001322A727|nr:bifunctional indole-3-glycerol-phosphate synthase TrpC/phosphoribosylanthranilate isomerase TrpF [Pantoea sp. Aalb]MXP67391.1 bifunctional indole-3-glycerol-phosphate synthase TrpC/phosphoribosylanthranilate isomerase TrpF [Pantoea sp. Aalb]
MIIKETILEKILKDKVIWIKERKLKQPLNTFKNMLRPTKRNFYTIVHSKKTVFILECKKASPSKGIINRNFNLTAIANVYRNYATVVSVLTEEKYFHGNFIFLSEMSAKVAQPILCKDFIIDPYQIYLARYYQADAVLLMLSILDDKKYNELVQIAHTFKMGVLTEVNNENEVKRAITMNAKVIGINNRNLHDLSINLNRTRYLAPLIKSGITIISESGINNYTQIRELSRITNGFLIGSAIMERKDLRSAVCRILIGENKICGLTRIEDIHSSYRVGAIYGGMIFVRSSPRKLTHMQAKLLVTTAPLKYVGIFCNNSIREIVMLTISLNLSAVQLHGNEDRRFINKLRQVLPVEVKIWKAFEIKRSIPKLDWQNVDRYVFDHGRGGTGQCFDWSLLQHQDMSKILLSGGLNINNCLKASTLGCAGLDFNSGIEIAPGIKNASKITEVFRILRTY